MRLFLTLFGLGLTLWITACSRPALTTRTESLRPTAMPALQDDLDYQDLRKALVAQNEILKKTPTEIMIFAARSLTRLEYAFAIESLLKETADGDAEIFLRRLRETFEAYEVYGQNDWGQILLTSYYEPVIDGSAKSSEKFSRPLYAVPKDLVTIELSTFKNIADSRKLRGRYIPADKDQSPRVVAYYDRAEIDSGVLKKQTPILAWVDPIDAFFLEIQGSGVVKFSNGKKLGIGYASQNGHPYQALGKYLFDVIPKEKMSQKAIENHLRSLSKEQAQTLMQKNGSFVFFRELTTRGITAIGAEVVSGRTLATDFAFFPKGALAYLQFDKPTFASPQDVDPVAWQTTSRLVLDQDTGGAIRGPARADLFWGQGSEAQQAAGVMKNPARLIYLAPRQDYLDSLKKI